MPLMEHIRELRNRIVKAAIALAIGMVIGWFIYPHVWTLHRGALLQDPAARPFRPRRAAVLVVNGIFDAFFIRLKLAFVVGIMLSSPVWLYQFWAFIAPGLYSRERRWAYYFVGAAVPLFAIRRRRSPTSR